MRPFLNIFACLVALCLPMTAVAQRQGAEQLVYELNFITRFMELDAKQRNNWNSAIAATKAMPDATKGTYIAMKSSLRNSTSRADFDFFLAYSDLINGLYGARNHTVDEHKKVAESWSRFDDDSGADQRVIFRSKISGLLIDFFNRMSDGNEKSLRFPSLENEPLVSQLGYSKEQMESIRIYSDAILNISTSAKENRSRSISNIKKVLSDSSIPFRLIPEEIEDSYNAHRALVIKGGEALNEMSKHLSMDQRKKINGIMLEKLRMLEKFIPNK